MAIPAKSDNNRVITLEDIAREHAWYEFQDDNGRPIRPAIEFTLSDFYRGGKYVANTTLNAGIPEVGSIELSDFYGTRRGEYVLVVPPKWFDDTDRVLQHSINLIGGTTNYTIQSTTISYSNNTYKTPTHHALVSTGTNTFVATGVNASNFDSRQVAGTTGRLAVGDIQIMGALWIVNRGGERTRYQHGFEGGQNNPNDLYDRVIGFKDGGLARAPTGGSNTAGGRFPEVVTTPDPAIGEVSLLTVGFTLDDSFSGNHHLSLRTLIATQSISRREIPNGGRIPQLPQANIPSLDSPASVSLRVFNIRDTGLDFANYSWLNGKRVPFTGVSFGSDFTGPILPGGGFTTDDFRGRITLIASRSNT